MKRTATRQTVSMSPRKAAQVKQLQRLVHTKEKRQLSKSAREFRQKHAAAELELARAAELLRAERLEQGLSLADIQEKSGMSRAAICRLENLVDANPTVATLDRMAEALGKRLVIALRDR